MWLMCFRLVFYTFLQVEATLRTRPLAAALCKLIHTSNIIKFKKTCRYMVHAPPRASYHAMKLEPRLVRWWVRIHCGGDLKTMICRGCPKPWGPEVLVGTRRHCSSLRRAIPGARFCSQGLARLIRQRRCLCTQMDLHSDDHENWVIKDRQAEIYLIIIEYLFWTVFDIFWVPPSQ